MKFKEGDQVFDLRYGWGIVDDIDNDDDEPFSVTAKFSEMPEGEDEETYTPDGKSYTDHKHPTLLTKEEAQVKYPEYPAPKKTKKKGFIALRVDNKSGYVFASGWHEEEKRAMIVKDVMIGSNFTATVIPFELETE